MPARKRAANSMQDVDTNPTADRLKSTNADKLPLSASVMKTNISVWDWELPSSNGAADADGERYNEYEPVGVLTKDSARRELASDAEFVVPQILTGDSSTSASDENNRPASKQSVAGVKRKSVADKSSSGENKRASVALSGTDEQILSPLELPFNMQGRPRSQSGPSIAKERNDDSMVIATTSDLDVANTFPQPSRRVQSDPNVMSTLPARKVFPIQVGDRLFRLSGASLSSDAPSYFTNFFQDQLRQSDSAESLKTLYIDRDPSTFEDIVLHLQGYHVAPRDGPHFVKLFADAQFFGLPRLTAQLFSSTIYIRIGDSEFQIPRDIFNNPGDSPNYFSLGFSTFFTTPADTGQSMAQRTLLRPPSILPPSVPNKSAQTFADLLHILKGYEVEIRNDDHRTDLLRDARYFHLKGLEQRLIPHEITYNLARQRSEILIRLEDIRQSGISFLGDGTTSQSSAAPSPATSSSNSSSGSTAPGWICYQRPYVDQESHALIVEIGSTESVTLSIAPASGSNARIGRVALYGQTLARITSLFSVIASKMNLPNIHPLGSSMMDRGVRAASLPASPAGVVMGEERVKVRIGPDADIVINGRKWLQGGVDSEDEDTAMEADQTPRPGIIKRKSIDPNTQDGIELVLRRSQWRVRIQPIVTGSQAGKGGVEAIFGAVKIDGFSHERARNAGRAFLNG